MGQALPGTSRPIAAVLEPLSPTGLRSPMRTKPRQRTSATRRRIVHKPGYEGLPGHFSGRPPRAWGGCVGLHQCWPCESCTQPWRQVELEAPGVVPPVGERAAEPCRIDVSGFQGHTLASRPAAGKLLLVMVRRKWLAPAVQLCKLGASKNKAWAPTSVASLKHCLP